jgi:hypothetical protein
VDYTARPRLVLLDGHFAFGAAKSPFASSNEDADIQILPADLFAICHYQDYHTRFILHSDGTHLLLPHAAAGSL